MDKFDRQVLRFVLAWLPYGRPPAEEIFCEFGVDANRLSELFTSALGDAVARTQALSRDDRQLLAQVRRGLGTARHR